MSTPARTPATARSAGNGGFPSLLASAAWRMEHRGTSWNAMRTSPHSPVSVVLAKTLVIVLPVLSMQVALIVLAWISGAFVMGLGLAMPSTVIASNLLAVVSIIPLIALQSLLSMLMRSFAAPVALGFVGCVLGFGLGAAQNPLAYAIPQGLVSMTLSLGSTAVTAGELDAASMVPLLLSIVGVGAVTWCLLVLVARQTGGVR